MSQTTQIESKVAIVTPVFTGAAFLGECIDSVLSQTYDNWKHVIVDNASTDATPEIIAAYAAREPRIRVHRNLHTVNALRNHNFSVKLVAQTDGGTGGRAPQSRHAGRSFVRHTLGVRHAKA